MPYLWLKAMHVAAVLIFIGGLLAQSLGIAAGAAGGAETVSLVSRWDRRVTLPAMLVVLLSGTFLATAGAWLPHHWLWVKLGFVAGLIAVHGLQSGRLRQLRRGDAREIATDAMGAPVVIMVAVMLIALLTVTKPF